MCKILLYKKNTPDGVYKVTIGKQVSGGLTYFNLSAKLLLIVLV